MANVEPIFRSILVAVDGSEHAGRAARMAIALALQNDARLMVLSAYRHLSYKEGSLSLVRTREVPVEPDKVMHDIAQDAVDWVVARAKDAGLKNVSKSVRRGPPARTIVRVAREKGVDAIVIGNRGLGDGEGFFLGSVSHKVNALCECTCITVK